MSQELLKTTKISRILDRLIHEIRRVNSTKFKLFIVTLVMCVYFINGFYSANEWSRYSLIAAIVEENTFIIDNYVVARLDTSYYDGHFYSDKPPGLSFIGVPVYFIAKILLINPLWIQFMLISLLALFTSLSVVLIYELAGYLGGNKTSQLLTALIYGFGTIAWVYSKNFFAHGFSAFLIILSIYYACLFVQENNTKFVLFSGIALGYSIVVDYPNILLFVPFLLYFVLYDTKKKLIYFIVPVAFFLMILGIYNYICFDSPFITAYRYQYHYGDTQNIGFFSNPVHIGLYGLLFSPFRGLFYLSPILLLSPIGFFYLYKKYKPETVLFLSSFAIIVLFYSTYTLWHGGHCYGPRYLLNAIPFITLPLALVIEKYKDQRIFVIFLILMNYSIFANAMGVIASYYLNLEIKNPLLYNIKHLKNRRIVESYFFSISPLTILFPIALILICVAPTMIRRFTRKSYIN